LADFYRHGWETLYGNGAALSATPNGASATQERVLSSADHLARNLDRVPVHVIPCVNTRLPGTAGNLEWSSTLGSVIPAVWSFQLALRSRGLGSVYTTLHLAREKDAARLHDPKLGATPHRPTLMS